MLTSKEEKSAAKSNFPENKCQPTQQKYATKNTKKICRQLRASYENTIGMVQILHNPL